LIADRMVRVRTAKSDELAWLLPPGCVGGTHRPDFTRTNARTMKPTPVAAQPTQNRPSRLLVVLAAAWMILSLAIGGAVAAEDRESAGTEAVTSVSATQP
jgi:hypothetical protein